MSTLADRWKEIQDRCAEAAIKSGRQPSDVTIIAVTKTHPVEVLQQAYELGIRQFGENRLQEALPKIAAMPNDIHWHLIGTLQSNKVRKAAAVFRTIHSIESDSQVAELRKQAAAVAAFLQVNLGRESQKSGIFEEDLDAALANVLDCPQIQLLGLMTIGPQVSSAEESRPYFRRLAELAKDRGLAGLSMGMSGDYEVAIEEGATHVRIGSALFGGRV